MRRLLAIVGVGLSLSVLLALGLGADDGGGGYRVRAIFDNVASAVPGEDVKVAGAKVGAIESMDVTKSKKAVVVLRIDDKRFTPFRTDATCAVRPQSLIGEKFVECKPGVATSAPLPRIRSGDGQGQHGLGLAQTSSPVDLDLINDINRRPYRERLSLLLNEFGTGLAGRGTDLNEVIHRANPALRETDKVLGILSRQNRVLGRLAVSSDRALGPLAREKERLTGFIQQAGTTASATAERRTDISRGLARLPRFLSELRPLMADLRGFSEQARPVASGLNRSGPDVSRLIQQLGPFSEGAEPSLKTLGDAARTGRPAVLRTRPLIQDLGRFAKQGRPLSGDLDRLTASIDKTGGIERLMDFIYFTTLAANGFDDSGYYERANLLNNLCSTYRQTRQEGCSSRFAAEGASASGAGSATAATVPGARPRDAARAKAGGATAGNRGGGTARPDVLGGILNSGLNAAGRKNVQRIKQRARHPHSGPKVSEPALDYLLGTD